MRLQNIFKITLGLTLSIASLNTQAIVIRHDKPDSDYQESAKAFAPYIAFLDRCTATVISDYWLITAAHCVNPLEQYPVKIQHLERDYPVDKIIRHPDFTNKGEPDMALIQLRWPLINAKSASLYQNDDELNKLITIVGKGKTGNGITGDDELDNVLRAATNTIRAVDGRWLEFEFNQPKNATSLEGVSGSGDSGGPAFILNNTPYLVGVSCCQESNKQGAYGAIEYYSRISNELDWLQKQMTEHPTQPQVQHRLLRVLRSEEQYQLPKLVQSDTSWQKSKKVSQELLIYSFITKNIELLKALIAAKPALLESKLSSLPLLDYALKQGNGQFFSYLLDMGADVTHLGFRKQHYLSRLMWQYFQDDANELAAKLLQKGLDIDQQDELGNSALHMAGFYGSVERVKFLVDRGANINLQDKDGETLLMKAHKHGQQDIVDYLLLKGAN